MGDLERAAVNVNHALLPREGGDLRLHAQHLRDWVCNLFRSCFSAPPREPKINAHCIPGIQDPWRS